MIPSPRSAPYGPGHTVLAVPVPPLELFVTERTAHYDPSFLSADPQFAHAHLTVLGPFLPAPTAADLALAGEVLGGFAPFEIELRHIAEFPDGLLHVVPEPAERVSAITDALATAFPQCPPYGGLYHPPVPHVTLDRRSDVVTPQWLAGALAAVLPTRSWVDRVDLQWWANHDCRLLHRWELTHGGAA